MFQIVSKSVPKELNRAKTIFCIYLAVYDTPQGHHSAVYHTPLSKHAEYSAKIKIITEYIPSVGLYLTGFWRFFGFFSKMNMTSP